MTGSRPPTLAVVVPIHGHPSLLIDAVESALAQQTQHEYRIVLVNDGCPFPLTDQICRRYAQLHPRTILYVHKRNGGLATARNHGLRLALTTWPSVRAVYFLDADNRLHPHVLERSYALLQADPDAGWVFPDVHMFGSSREFCDTTGAFSRLQLLAHNYCEAGSMVRREVFESGVAFDETMKPSGGCPMGFEDWDFWLQCLAAGFKGQHGPALGFRYRKRPESMLTNSERDRAAIVGYMRRKHAELYTPRRMKEHEQEEMPRFAIYLADRDELILTSDCDDLSRRQTWAEFRRALRRHQTNPRLQGVPPTILVTTGPTLRLLRDRHLAANLFWLLEADLEAHQLVTLSVEQWMGTEVRYELSPRAAGNGKVAFRSAKERPFAERKATSSDAVLLGLRSVLLADCLSGREPAALASLSVETDESVVASRHLRIEHLEQPAPLPAGVAGKFCATVARRRPDYCAVPPQRINSRRIFYRTPSDAGLIARLVFQAPAAPPFRCRAGERHIGFVLDHAAFDSLTPIVCNVARETTHRGWRPHLFVLGDEAGLFAEFRDTFDSIHLLPDEALHQPDRLVSLLGTMDVVVNNQCAALYAAQGDLKRLGIKLITNVQGVEWSADGAPGGPPYLAVQYEHSLHKLVVPSEEMRTFLLARGIPPNKLLVVRNAPSFTVPLERLDAALAERAARREEEPLRILVTEPLDGRRECDRLAQLVFETDRLQLDVAWRIIGEPVIDGDARADAGVKALEPYLQSAARDAHTLTRHYCWADVLLLPARGQEGALALLDAQQFGCVPIVTHSGSAGELIEHGQTGFLLRDTDDGAWLTEQILALFTALRRDRRQLIDMARQASAVRRAQPWRQTLRDLLDCLDAWCPRQGAA